MKKRLISLLKNSLLVILSTVIFLLILEGIAYLILKKSSTGYYEKDFENTLGLRDPRQPSEIYSNEVILILGDSFTYGVGVKCQESYPVQLEKNLNITFPNRDIVVINGGSPGFDTQMEYSKLKRIYDYYQPKYVIIGFHSGDIFQNQIAFREIGEVPLEQEARVITKDEMLNIIKNREKDLPKLFLLKNYLNQISNTARVFTYYYKNYLIRYIRPPQDVKAMRSGPEYSKEFDATEYFLDEIHTFLSAKNTKMIVLLIIPLIRFDAYPYEHINDAIKKYAESRNIYFIDPLDAFSKYKSSSLWASMNDDHYNAKANSVIAEVLKDFFVDNKLLENAGQY